MARPIEWTDDKIELIAHSIFKRIAAGESVREILGNSEDDDLPARKTFYEWVSVNKSLSDQYGKAMEVRAENMADEILEIADNFEHDVTKLDGLVITDHAVINRDRLRVDARKWLLSKLQPKKYGDKLDIDHTTAGQPFTKKTHEFIEPDTDTKPV